MASPPPPTLWSKWMRDCFECEQPFEGAVCPACNDDHEARARTDGEVMDSVRVLPARTHDADLPGEPMMIDGGSYEYISLRLAQS